ncbi:hypothetical protein BU15DRAFT_66499 [Melanogaster broomeanus]|nr:hypothetical protein BU15DRAFT_66499 [Melanogaster broomeanus]
MNVHEPPSPFLGIPFHGEKMKVPSHTTSSVSTNCTPNGIGPSLRMQPGSHQVHLKDFYLRVNWERLVTREIFRKQCKVDERYLDTLFNATTLTQFWPSAESTLRRLTVVPTLSHANLTPPSPPPDFDLWNALFNILKRKGHWVVPNSNRSSLNGGWKNCPKLDTWTTEMEPSLANFLNNIAAAIAGSTQTPIVRSWTAKYSTSSVFGHTAQCKPDLVLLDGSPSQMVVPGRSNWGVVRAVAEVRPRSRNTTWKEISEQLAGEVPGTASIIWGIQDGRDSVVTVGFAQDAFQIVTYDRGGVIVSPQYSIHDNPIHPWILPSVTKSSGLPHRFLSMQAPLTVQPTPETFTIHRVLFISDSAIGQGSILWHVSDAADQQFIVKDTWHDPHHNAYTEGEILQLLGDDIDGIPIFVEECVVGDPLCSSTSARRVSCMGYDVANMRLGQGKFDERIHLRLRTRPPRNADPTHPIARPIYCFSSREELIRVFIDCIKAHRKAFARGVLHRSITFTNLLIMATVLTGSSAKSSVGFLTDWGFALVDKEKAAQFSEPKFPTPWPNTKCFARATDQDDTLHHTASLMYDTQSAEHTQSSSPHRSHKVHHDLESFFYVLLVICILFEGPRQHRQLTELEDTVLNSWWTPNTYQLAADFKASAFTCGLPSFKRIITSRFTPYFRPLIEPITELFDAIFGGMKVDDPMGKPTAFDFQVINDSPVTYDLMLEKMELVLSAATAADAAGGLSGTESPATPATPFDEDPPVFAQAETSDAASIFRSTHSFFSSTTDPVSTTSSRTVGSGVLLLNSPECYNLRLELADTSESSTTPCLPPMNTQDVPYVTKVVHLPLGLCFKVVAPSTDVPLPVYPDLLPEPCATKEVLSESSRGVKRPRMSAS